MELMVRNLPGSLDFPRCDGAPRCSTALHRMPTPGSTSNGPSATQVRAAVLTALVTIVILALSAPRASAQWTLETKDGKANLRVGFLAQPQM